MTRQFLHIPLLIWILTAFAAPPAAAETVQDLHSVNTYRVTGEVDLKVTTPAGNIEVISTPESDSVRVEMYVERGLSIWSTSRNLEDYRIVSLMRGDEIVAAVEPKERVSRHRVTFSYRIWVPENVNLQLRSSFGNISIRNVWGMQQLYTNAGDIRVYGSGGKISGKSNAGDIQITEGSGELRLSVVGGNIRADRISGAMVAQVISGDITAHFDRITEGINLESIDGNVSVHIPSHPYRFHARGSRIDFSVTEEFSGIRRTDQVRGRFRGGDGPLITLTTLRGIISIETQ